ncbi:MAG: hypothetical protein ACE363_11800 [Alphaproteobacteria bacterium]
MKRLNSAKKVARHLAGICAMVGLVACGEATSENSDALKEVNAAIDGGMRGGMMLLPGGGLKTETALLRFRRASLDDGKLIADAEVCTVPEDQTSQIGDCLSNGDWKPIVFSAALSDLDPATAKISESTFLAGGVYLKPHSLLVRCREGLGECAEDTVYGPLALLSITCRDKAACEAALPAFKKVLGAP